MKEDLYRCIQQFSIPVIMPDGRSDTVTIFPGKAVWKITNFGKVAGTRQEVVTLALDGVINPDTIFLPLEDFKILFAKEEV